MTEALNVKIVHPSPADLVNKFKKVRQHSIHLCRTLQTEDFVVQPVVDVSPPKWHLAHTTWFWEEMVLSQHVNEYKRFHPRYAFLFNSYYDSVGERVLRLDRGNMSRPTVDDIFAYRRYVDEKMEEFLSGDVQHLRALIELAINHEQQHQELLLTDIKYILGHNPLFPVYDADFDEGSPVDAKLSYIHVEEGIYSIGASGEDFFFDNEGDRHNVFISDFSIANTLVSNGEFLEFMADGGYTTPTLWHSDGWAWKNAADVNSPMYWHKLDGQWFRYALTGLQPVRLDEPVTHINFYEASAFAEWKGERLPTEFEWEAASNLFSWGSRWEHTQSAYTPYPGFKKAPGALGEYNGKFMVNQMVLRGASVATPDGHSRKTYRNFFHPHLRWQFTGIRLCKKQ